MTVINLDHVWGWLLIGGSVVWAVHCLRIWRRGWMYDEEEDTTYDRRSHPRSFLALQVLHIVGFVAILYPGLASLNGWWR